MAVEHREYQKVATRVFGTLNATNNEMSFSLAEDIQNQVVGGRGMAYRSVGMCQVEVQNYVAGGSLMWWWGIRRVDRHGLSFVAAGVSPGTPLGWDWTRADEKWLHFEMHSMVPHHELLLLGSGDDFIWSFPFNIPFNHGKGVKVVDDGGLVLVAGAPVSETASFGGLQLIFDITTIFS